MSDEPSPWTEGHPWIVVQTRSACFECLRCGATESFSVPVRLEEWVGKGQQFVKDHAGCGPTSRRRRPIRPTAEVIPQEGML